MSRSTTIETIEESDTDRRRASIVAGIVVVFSGGAPRAIACPVDGKGVVLGRDWLSACGIDDDRASREHARVRFAADGLEVEDLGSKNGTFVDGQRVSGVAPLGVGEAARIGNTVVLAVPDCAAFARDPTRTEGEVVRGPRTASVLRQIRELGKSASSMLILGESGVGKENAARAFHQAGPFAKGPFVAVNCAAVPETLAERLFFGAKQGAFSGSTDAEGYVRAAHRGTLFLDELGELDLALQAKLLRLVEAHEIMPVGAARAERVELTICAATNRDIRAEVARKKFREDLYYRLAEPSVEVPALRERREEISWLVARAIASVDESLTVTAKLVEECLRRPWPGNVRELLAAASQAARRAKAEGRGVVAATDLHEQAGLELSSDEGDEPGPAAGARPPKALPDDATIERTLAASKGSVSAAARALDVHRTQLRRWLSRRRG